jgi:hypothetical protein
VRGLLPQGEKDYFSDTGAHSQHLQWAHLACFTYYYLIYGPVNIIWKRASNFTIKLMERTRRPFIMRGTYHPVFASKIKR